MALDPGLGASFARIRMLELRIAKLEAAMIKAIASGPPVENGDGSIGSIGYYVCCQNAETQRHADECWWNGLRKALESK